MNWLWRRTVRFGFRLLYQEFAFTYDTVSWLASMGAWRCWVEAALRHLPPAASPVLELAHGPGHLQVTLAQRGLRAFGLDYSAQMGRQARRRLNRAGYPSRLVRARAQALPYADESFAAVVSTFPTEYIVDPRTLDEVRRVLRPGAPLIIVPAASFTKRGAGQAALAWAYQVTGQRNAEQTRQDNIAHYFEPHGFMVEVFEEACPHSVALVVVCRKSPSARQKPMLYCRQTHGGYSSVG